MSPEGSFISASPVLRLQVHAAAPSFSRGRRGLNSDLHAWIANMLWTELLPGLCLAFTTAECRHALRQCPAHSASFHSSTLTSTSKLDSNLYFFNFQMRVCETGMHRIDGAVTGVFISCLFSRKSHVLGV